MVTTGMYNIELRVRPVIHIERSESRPPSVEQLSYPTLHPCRQVGVPAGYRDSV